ncbi:hypothetical protein M9H77_06651 [Catharanthus roseus]|uniref:Uncharacterized protein n=1 Tax=Catharanthus roseus TaxID=4058 RepID=A0ACC0BSX3_CATRO|nr:hypothetical protein M9H77_06651 [Catharanthus roseus]
MSHGLPYACELITRFDHVLPIQLYDIDAFWKTLEIGGRHPLARQQDMDSEMRSLTDILHQISTGPISKVREMRHLAKGVLNPVLPEDPGSGLGSHGRGRPPRAPSTRGRGRDRGQSSLSAVIHASPCSTFPYTNAFSAFIYPFISNWKNVIGDGNCGYRVVADLVFGDEHQWPEIHWPVDEPVSYVHWFETPDSLYIIANAFNLCVILIVQLGSTTVLPLCSYSDCPGGTLVIGLLTEERHFVQLQLNDMRPIPPLHVQ